MRQVAIPWLKLKAGELKSCVDRNSFNAAADWAASRVVNDTERRNGLGDKLGKVMDSESGLSR